MRFEIGPGGILLVLLGLAGLSAGVFGLGLVAGHELAGPEPGSQPAVAAYPLPPDNSGPSAPAPVEASAPPPAPAVNSARAVASAPQLSPTRPAPLAASVQPRPAPAPAVALRAPAPAVGAAVSAPAARRSAASSTAVATRASRRASAVDEDYSTGAAVAPPSETASAAAEGADTGASEPSEGVAPIQTPPPHRLAAVSPPRLPASPSAAAPASGPYSVQIDAMMDLPGARQMAQKMRARGFEPYIVPTFLQGKTWYRLRVGHYATPEQAQAAEARLHQEFDENSGN
jgi:cell division septation protein DedD